VSMSAMGSVVFIVWFVLLGGGSRHAVAWEAPAADGPLPAAAPSVWYRLPAGLGHSRQQAVEGPLPEADAAHPETTHEAARAAAEGAGWNPAEVADAGERQVERALQEVVHALAAERDLGADGHPGAQPELRDGALRSRNDRPLAGDDRQVAHGGVDRLGVLDRLTPTDVDDHLFHARDLHGIGVPELALQRRL